MFFAPFLSPLRPHFVPVLNLSRTHPVPVLHPSCLLLTTVFDLNYFNALEEPDLVP